MAVRQYKPALFRTVAGGGLHRLFLVLGQPGKTALADLIPDPGVCIEPDGQQAGDAGEPNHSFTLAVGQVIESADGLVIERRFNVNAR